MRELITRTTFETKRFATNLAKKIFLSKPGRQAKIIGLVGELGSGKTTFIQGFIRAVGIKLKITSPTFLIFRPYKLRRKKFQTVYHADLYRIKSFKELKSLGFNRILANPNNVILIEWAEKIKKDLPKNVFWINFYHGSKLNERVIRINQKKL